MVSRDENEWFYDEPANKKTPIRNIVRQRRSAYTSDVSTPVEATELFLDNDILIIIVECTNKEGRMAFGEKKSEWVDTDKVEIQAFLATLLSVGSMKHGMIDLKLVFHEVGGSLFGYNRLVTLLACLHFDDKNMRSARKEKDPLAPIREVWDRFERSLKRHYTPGSFLTIDGQLVPFRGLCKFRMYIPIKPDKYDLKIYWLCESDNGYPLRGLPYLGKVGRLPEKDHGENCVRKLIEPYYRSGRNVTFVNFFTTFKLTQHLLKEGLTCVGTVRKDKKFIPEPLRHHSFSKDKQYPSRFAFQEKATVVSCISKKNKVVTLSSTMHSDKTVSQHEKKQPDIVLYYNLTKGGVDGMDQKVHKYSCKRKSQRWPMTYFFNIVDVSCLAAHIIFKNKFPNHPLGRKDSRSHFIRAVASGLAQAQLFRRQEIPTLSHYLKEAISISLANLGQDKPRQTRKGLPQPSTPQSESKGRQQVKKQQDDKKSFCCITCNNTQDKKAATQMQNLPLEKGQKVITTCSKCGGFVCGEQRHFVCSDCMNAHNVTSN